ncbi:lysophospholipase/glycerophospholipid:cholesterol acyltransferase PlaC [Legionella waltersii]|uniref:Phospholipase/lecithinase/hemolysin n=1 Tax=Legionella waltersii TaxID=66969 RepID=A0A0W1A4S0_9GAMM|nr:SGNH/GDSL hydrolase family protein [Legionella waltersii]KTD76341.1 phospholipase/lecithinase/hemolysin [Legionella waltersii]SNV13833.1 phospholipase/lecithinase/hemolysin, lysophospholipase A, glycerophospholipid-cholesterol acyltransferase [Legionella waltersii]
MVGNNRICRWLFIALLAIPFVGFTAAPVKSMVVFGDSLSDVGNTTHLLKSLRQEEDPAFLVAPFKIFVINKMIEFADDYYVPQIVLDAGIAAVTDFFDHELAPYIANLVAKVKLVPVLPGQPYWKYRFSNGKIWAEYLAEMMSIQKSDDDVYLNRAFGGSWASTYDYQLTVWNLIRHPLGTIKNLIVGKLVPPSLGLTVQAYLLEHQTLNDQSVYFIYSGGNDYINVLFFEDNYNTDVMSTYIDNVLDSITSAMQKLVKAGAKRFVVMGVPNIGETPKFVKTTDREVLNAAVEQHNQRLAKRIEAMKEQNPDLDILFVDTQNYLQRALVDPEKYGFYNVKDACIDVKFPMLHKIMNRTPFPNNYVLQYMQVLQYRDSSFAPGETNYHVCDAPEDYLFWDEIHPSTKAHQLMAYEVCQEMLKHGYDVTCKQPEVG